ncbi:hypothetical protein FACS1894217_01560 [Clostridia bacterium]|nr:hypothetical protein FACS1894217_01560 [Clostridia bacterium]
MKSKIIPLLLVTAIVASILSACSPGLIAMTKSNSLDSVKQTLDQEPSVTPVYAPTSADSGAEVVTPEPGELLDLKQLVYPTAAPELTSDKYDVTYYYLSNFATPNFDHKKNAYIKTGYLIDLKQRDGSGEIKYSGFSIRRDNGWSSPTAQTTSIDKATTVDFQDKQLVWATYREYPYTENEKQEQKEQPTTQSSTTSLAELFTIYYAYVDIGDARYTFELSGISFNGDSAETVKARCLEEAQNYFTNLFDKENAQ